MRIHRTKHKDGIKFFVQCFNCGRRAWGTSSAEARKAGREAGFTDVTLAGLGSHRKMDTVCADCRKTAQSIQGG